MMASGTDGADQPERSKVVVILGAGFSHAVYDPCPTTDGLGEAVRARLTPDDSKKMPVGKFANGRFEEWLSYLSEPQPHHDPEEAAEASALALRVTRVVREVLTEVQNEALVAGPPPWFFEFLSVLHALRARVITLNYDNFVECGVLNLRLQAPDSFGPTPVCEDDILEGNPPPAIRAPTQTESHLVALPRSRLGPADTFRLMKLHGSLSWYWLPEGGGSSTLRRWYLPGVFGELCDPKDELRRQELPAHEVFIVPPAALKGQRLKEPVTRELWRRAAEALKEAERVVLIGYSVPLADHSLIGMLSDGLQGREVSIEIVNPCPGEVTAQLVRLGISTASMSTVSGQDCVACWTTAKVTRLASNAVEAIRCDPTITGDEVVWADGRRAERLLSRIDQPSDGLTPLVLHMNPRGQQLSNPLRYSDVREPLSSAGECFVEVDGELLPVIDYWRLSEGAMRTPQLHLVTAGR